MHQSKLFTLLQGLKPEEIRWFQKFLKSPFYNTNEQHTNLFNYIKKYHPELDSPKLSKEAACKKLFPKQAFNVQKIRKLMHGLTLLAEEFIVAMRLKNNEYQKKRLLVSELGERNVYDLFKKGTEELMEELETLPYRDAFFYQEMQVLNLEFYGHVETNKQTTGMKHIKATLEYLDAHYLLQKQRLKYAIKEHEKLLSNSLKVNSLEQNRYILQKTPIFKLYELLFKSLDLPSKTNIYLEIEALFKQEIKKIGQNNRLEIIQILLNYWGSYIGKGESKSSPKVFELYKFGLEHSIIIQNKQISETTFSNIVTIGLLEKEFRWVENFIKTYQFFLPESLRQDAICLSYGFLYLKQKKYTKVTELFLNYTFVAPLRILKSKSILLRTYFEQFLLDSSYYDLLFMHTQSFEKFVRRNNFISSIKKEAYLNFILFTRKVAHAILEHILTSSLIEQIKIIKPMVLKFWLLEKIETNLEIRSRLY